MNKPQQYRVKSNPVEALQYTGKAFEYFDFHQFVGKKLFPYMMDPSSSSLHVYDDEGVLQEVKEGYYVVKFSDGEYLAYKPEIFEQMYEKV